MIRKIHTLLAARRGYYIYGALLFLFFFIFANVMNFSLSYMGNKSDEVASMIVKLFWSLILWQVVKVIAVTVAIGVILNIIYKLALNFASKRFAVLAARRVQAPLITALMIATTFALLLKYMVLHPQLFMENLTVHASWLERFHYFLTDNFSPFFFTAIFIIINVPLLTLAILSFDWKRFYSYAKRAFSGRVVRIYAAILSLLVILFGALYKGGVIFHTESSRKNIIVIASDAVRPDRFSGNGYSRDTTPNIDRLMKESVQFRGVTTAVPRTFPSWVSMLSSQYPLSHEIRHMFPRSRERSVKIYTACDRLKEEGYRTSVVSDFAGDIFPRFDFGFDNVKAPYFNFDSLIKQIVFEKQTFLLPFMINDIGRFLFPEMRGIAKFSIPEVITDETIDEIESARGEPFFVTVFYSITHFPFSAPYPYYKSYADKNYSGPYKYLKQVVLKIGKNESEKNEGVSEISEADKKQVNDLYDGCLKMFDAEVGKLYDYLSEHDLLENTIIVIYADHGENIYDLDFGMGHGEHLKGRVALEVPFIVRAPQFRDIAGRSIDIQSSTIDVMPTIFDAANIDAPKSFRGRSLLEEGKRDVDSYCETGIWFDNNKKSNLFFQHERIDYPDITALSDLDTNFGNEMVIKDEYQNVVSGAKYRAICSEGYKLIYIPLKDRVKYELYDSVKDPMNQNDLASAKPDVVERLRKRLFEFVKSESSGNFIEVNGYLLPAFSDPLF